MNKTLVVHIAIQWLASKNLLVQWMDNIINEDAENYYTSRLHEYDGYNESKEAMLDLLVYMPYWGATSEGDAFWQNYSNEWRSFLRSNMEQFK